MSDGERKRGYCASHPFCNLKVAKGRRFCAEHAAILDRVQAVLNPRLYRKQGKDEAALPAALMTVTHVEPQPTAKPARAERTATSRIDWQARMLDALKGGPLSSSALSAACGTTSQDRTFARHRLALFDSGRIVEVPGKAGRGSGRIFALPPAATPATA